MNFTLNFDHIFHYIEQPEKISEELQKHGLQSVAGGRHEGFGTYNYLTNFGLSYIEWVGIFDREQLKTLLESPYHGPVASLARDSFVEGPARFAVRTNNIEALGEHLQSKGYDVLGPQSYSRRRPDGTLLKWKLLFAGNTEHDLPLPFFIQWEGEDEDRRTELELSGEIIPHSRGEVVFDHVAMVVRNLEDAVQTWSDWLGVAPGETVYHEQLKGQATYIQLQNVKLIFVQPSGEGPSLEALQARGERPFAIGLRTDGSQDNSEYTYIRGAWFQFS
jgi:hypothetical protein